MGRGSFATVFHARKILENKSYAVKVFNKSKYDCKNDTYIGYSFFNKK